MTILSRNNKTKLIKNLNPRPGIQDRQVIDRHYRWRDLICAAWCKSLLLQAKDTCVYSGQNKSIQFQKNVQICAFSICRPESGCSLVKCSARIEAPNSCSILCRLGSRSKTCRPQRSGTSCIQVNLFTWQSWPKSGMPVPRRCIIMPILIFIFCLI